MTSHAMPLAGRLMSKVEFDPSGCWLWTAYVDAESGYGRLTFDSRPIYAHRSSFEVFVGPIPDGMHLDHQCHNSDDHCPGGRCHHRRCINPWHLRPATPLENTRSGKGNAVKTHCPQGHEYDVDNTLRTSGRRYCRTCQATRLERVRPEQHGTSTAYAYGCRCDTCREGSAARYRESRAAVSA